MLSRAVFCLFIFAPTAGSSEPTLHTGETWTYGIGLFSCAHWRKFNYPEIVQWVSGYWSGLNAYSLSRHTVGSTTDAVAIVEAVRRECEIDPTERISAATWKIYARLDAQGR